MSRIICVKISDGAISTCNQPEANPQLCSNTGERLLRHPSNAYGTTSRWRVGTRQRRKCNRKGPYKCNFCGKVLLHKYNLELHMRTHTGERPYRCPLCPMACAQKGVLVRHIRLHTGEKPFQCSFCPEVFSRKCYRTKHEEEAHMQHAMYAPQ
ncbi:hypothetical protein HPB50_001456 [Hyalomma asiaticum]|uniref:Uncharacterized protein n=1 Tax=Hyalomma asiaticum TaxID=266040 RepID=A0ACB7RGF0_HYAAI|nr:hypothetical protein HPB50_001456 [Hyalomma asiaticum]